MSGGPSRRRREGRQAFYRGGDPDVHNPYSPGTYEASDWRDGWREAKKDDDIVIQQERQAEFEDIYKVIEFARLYNLAKEQGLIT
ncbi:hypothetical protein [Bradyrhizobium sp. 2S1]|uniref:hypothetical protein n=1 Tax=Bradyrhizobium sp. 2S1 TaxID=1404429 RepID=UPI00140B7E7A|nr:hypothetical protein [Bradyrhizobium sp. 2S1]MCK7669357.1 hypothetical protein [Bradyrhizobium sp. 2S1]